jgi:bifunctional non-homologous end joining protein LigD
MGLLEYKQKRHFARTPEPSGRRVAQAGHSFCIQKHAASHLHYDFRLELDGVLKSWAVPKGPSLDPSVKRLAMHVEDHPVEYGKFEGIIPQGQYGGGTVMLWDRGEWEAIGDAAKGYRDGRLKFQLHGEKLHGAWMLVRTGGKSSAKEERRWLLFKERDDEAKSTDEVDVLEERPLSVSTGRSLEEIAQGTKAKKKPSKPTKGKPAKKVPSPRKIEVQLATLTQEAPEGDEWLHEIKYDGYRMICRIVDGHAIFLSRNHQDWTKRLQSLADRATKLSVHDAVLDGEVVAVRPDGITHFQDLQNAFRDSRTDQLQYFVFDLLHLDGRDLARLPLVERKQILAELLGHRGTPAAIKYSEHIVGNGPAFFRESGKRGLEGIICKRADSPYRGGRGSNWLKVKCVKEEEFVIGGFTEPAGNRNGFGAILVGYHDDKGKLIYAGKVGTGFDDKTLRLLQKQFSKVQQAKSPFSDRKSVPAKTHWLKPTLVAQITYGSRTAEGILRHASFQGLREDKHAAEVTEEKPAKLAKIRSVSKPMAQEKDYDAQNEELDGVRLTSPTKILYPDAGLSKLDLARYYRDVAEWLLPHIADRPLVLVRCPDGQAKECFYQKHPGQGTPDTLKRISIKQKSSTEEYVVVDDVAGLISLAQIGALEVHAWGSRKDALDKPDRLIFDLDPDPSVPWKRVVESGHQVRKFLHELGLESFVKLTGGKGLHLVVPIERRHDWKVAKAFCKQVADAIVSADPRNYVANMSKAARHGKIFIDYLRNDRGSTAVVPYSPRAKSGATVAVPITWTELSDRIPSDHYTISTLAKRLALLKTDPWKGIEKTRQSLTEPLKLLDSLSKDL